MLYEGGARFGDSVGLGAVEAGLRLPVDLARRTGSAAIAGGFGDGDRVRLLCDGVGFWRAESAEWRCATEPPDEPEAALWFRKRETPSTGMEGSVDGVSFAA